MGVGGSHGRWYTNGLCVEPLNVVTCRWWCTLARITFPVTLLDADTCVQTCPPVPYCPPLNLLQLICQCVSRVASSTGVVKVLSMSEGIRCVQRQTQQDKRLCLSLTSVRFIPPLSASPLFGRLLQRGQMAHYHK